MILKRILLSALFSAAATMPALAQMDHSKMGHGMMSMSHNPADQAFMAAMTRMHKDMNTPMTGNADVDFVRGMIPHHQGAIDMAKIELQYGKDESLRKLAEGIVKAQESEIAFMKDWLAKNAK